MFPARMRLSTHLRRRETLALHLPLSHLSNADSAARASIVDIGITPRRGIPVNCRQR